MKTIIHPVCATRLSTITGGSTESAMAADANQTA